MKLLLTFSLLFISTISFSQSKIATTEDGRRVLLKSNNTWEFIDNASTSKTVTNNQCNLGENFVEPKSEKSINAWLKYVNATTEDLKKHVAVENDCKVEDVKLINISEQKGNGMYSLCVQGKEMKYKRMGSVFMKADANPLQNK